VPEVLEVELTRRAASSLIGRRFVAVERTDGLVVATGVDEAVVDATIEGLDRRGKVLAVHTDGPTIGLHFGMTGRLLRDDTPVALARLEYGSLDDDARWDRWVARLDDGSTLRFHDPRRLGRIWPEPELERLGPDALSLTRRQLEIARLLASRATNAEIASSLGISVHTARHHSQRVLEKLGITSRAEVRRRFEKSAREHEEVTHARRDQ